MRRILLAMWRAGLWLNPVAVAGLAALYSLQPRIGRIAQGCHEMASDADSVNTLSQRVYEASGFIVAGRSVRYRKNL